MNAIFVIVAAVIALLGLLFASVMGYIWLVAHNTLSLWRKSPIRPDTVSVHTYKPNHSTIPLRGWLVLREGCSLASKSNCPLILSVGNTVLGERRTEAQIYQDEALWAGASYVSIVTGENPQVRETLGEVEETLMICRRKLHSVEHVAVGLAPHMARIRLLWRRAHPEGRSPHVTFVPVSGPWRYWPWEAAMLCLYVIAPPRSKLQNFLLDLVGRKG